MNVIVFILYILLEKTIPLFPLGFVRWLARIYGNVFYYLIPIRRKVAVGNLKLAFPEMGAAERKRILKAAYINVMTVIFEFFYFRKLDEARLRKMISISNIDIIREKLKKGKGLILVCGHFGNWELAAFATGRMCGEPMHVIVKEQKNKMVDKRINRIRTLRGNVMIDMSQGLRDVLRVLHENKIIAMLSDQSAPKENSVKVDFFVKDVPTFEGAAKFALKTGAAVLFGVPMRGQDGNYTITFTSPPARLPRRGEQDQIRELTQWHATMLEEYIRKHPEQWLWFHRRFKTV